MTKKQIHPEAAREKAVKWLELFSKCHRKRAGNDCTTVVQ